MVVLLFFANILFVEVKNVHNFFLYKDIRNEHANYSVFTLKHPQQLVVVPLQQFIDSFG